MVSLNHICPPVTKFFSWFNSRILLHSRGILRYSGIDKYLIFKEYYLSLLSGAFCDTVSQRSNFRNWKCHPDVLRQRFKQIKITEFQLLCKTAGTADHEQHLTGDFRVYFGTEVNSLINSVFFSIF